MADPICTFLFSVFVLFTTFTIIRDILIVLMEGKSEDQAGNHNTAPSIITDACISVVPTSGAPAGLRYSDVRDGLLAVNGVTAVHNLHIWALTMNQAVLTAHVAIGEGALVPLPFDTSAADGRQGCPSHQVDGAKMGRWNEERHFFCRCGPLLLLELSHFPPSRLEYRLASAAECAR